MVADSKSDCYRNQCLILQFRAFISFLSGGKLGICLAQIYQHGCYNMEDVSGRLWSPWCALWKQIPHEPCLIILKCVILSTHFCLLAVSGLPYL